VRSKFFGALQVLPATDGAAGAAPVTTSTAYVLEWRGEGDLAPADIWIRETESDGALATFSVNGKI
jgi:hypothetical protein